MKEKTEKVIEEFVGGEFTLSLETLEKNLVRRSVVGGVVQFKIVGDYLYIDTPCGRVGIRLNEVNKAEVQTDYRGTIYLFIGYGQGALLNTFYMRREVFE